MADAVFAACDAMALGALEAFVAADMAVPTDLGVMGFRRPAGGPLKGRPRLNTSSPPDPPRPEPRWSEADADETRSGNPPARAGEADPCGAARRAYDGGRAGAATRTTRPASPPGHQ